MGVDYTEIISGKLKPVYILTGDDTYTKDIFEKKLLSLLSDTHGSCHSETLDGKESDYSSIISIASSGSLLSKTGFIVIKRGDSLMTSEAFRDFLTDYYKKDDPPNILVIECEKSGRFRKIAPIKIDTPYENRLPGWIKQSISRQNRRISDDAANLLAFYCGRNLHNITKEIEKLLTAYPEKNLYGIEEVKAVAGSYRKEDIFAFLNALEDHNEKTALRLLNEMLNFGTEPLQITGMLKWKLQQMIIARTHIEKGLSERDIISRMNLSPYLYRGLNERLKKFTLIDLIESYNRLHEMDCQLKTVSADKNLLIENFTFRFLNG
ncbi:MAG: DNA polymerase III subunit delta [Elusimicrobiota bacterium]